MHFCMIRTASKLEHHTQDGWMERVRWRIEAHGAEVRRHCYWRRSPEQALKQAESKARRDAFGLRRSQEPGGSKNSNLHVISITRAIGTVPTYLPTPALPSSILVAIEQPEGHDVRRGLELELGEYACYEAI
ncbi:hypothetical protein NA56DRAFT_744791 [Hyaloscypha hepaticicola]|uniref:Uncharacterized protein n=1 Tax=Hyaloscypha hepaticicola TaxID=2082293 RepID=A0A2J6QHP1_9HELO|nr:hypothetical protein NA56DRAFT_744791 [Hyaloscypha hepaticicola]